jgi:hypothetical protein
MTMPREISPSAKIQDLLSEPAFSTVGFTDDVVDQTVVETLIFLRDPEDEDSDVLLSRTVELNAAEVVLTRSAYALVNAPTITSVVTDQSDDSTIAKNGTTVLTITGENFGAEDADIQVLLLVPQRTRHDTMTPTRNGNMLMFEAAVTEINVGKTEITASVTLASQPRAEVTTGTARLEVRNTKRALASGQNLDLTVV